MNQGVIEQPLISLTVQAVPDRIPNSIEVDISALAIGDTIRVADLPLPEGVTTEVDGDEAVVIAQGSALAAQVAADEELTPAADEAPVAPVESPEG
jgi:large subunit ribosomal protein L25